MKNDPAARERFQREAFAASRSTIRTSDPLWRGPSRQNRLPGNGV